MRNISGVVGVSTPEKHVLRLRQGKTNIIELLPEDDVWFWDRRMGGEEGDDSMGVGGRDGGEEGGCVEGAGVEEVGGFCGVRNISNHGYRCEDWRENRDF